MNSALFKPRNLIIILVVVLVVHLFMAPAKQSMDSAASPASPT